MISFIPCDEQVFQKGCLPYLEPHVQSSDCIANGLLYFVFIHDKLGKVQFMVILKSSEETGAYYLDLVINKIDYDIPTTVLTRIFREFIAFFNKEVLSTLPEVDIYSTLHLNNTVKCLNTKSVVYFSNKKVAGHPNTMSPWETLPAYLNFKEVYFDTGKIRYKDIFNNTLYIETELAFE